MSTQRHDAPPVHKRPGTQARHPRPQRQEPETLEDAERYYDDDVSAIPIPHVVRRYDTEQPTPGHAITKRPPLNVQVHPHYALDGCRTRIPPRRSRVEAPPTPPPAAPARRQAPPTRKPQQAARFKLPRLHWLVYVGVAMAVMVTLWVMIGAIVSAWNWESNNLTYGYPRTYQCDAVVGHADSSQDPSHFLALNLHSHLEVIELPGGDATHAKIYFGPVLVGQGQDLTPVTLTFKDVTGDGKPDMLIHFSGQTTLWINTGSAFRTATPSDHVSV